jgi:hypothetical protein
MKQIEAALWQSIWNLTPLKRIWELLVCFVNDRIELIYLERYEQCK